MSSAETQLGVEPDGSGACTCIFCAAQQAWSASAVGDGGYQPPAEASATSQGASGSQDINGLLSGSKWVGALTYSFPTSGSFYGNPYGSNEPSYGFSQLNATQQAAANAAVQHYNLVSNVGITQITETSTNHADIRFANSSKPSTAWAYYPGNYSEAGDAWFGPNFTNPIKGSYSYVGFFHELGHSLGLKHGQETNVYGALPADHDSMEFSVMTYRSYVGQAPNGYTNQSSSYAQTLMMDDIAAIQFMYGANFNTNSGNTTYTWSSATGEMFLNGVGQGAPSGNRIFLTIWDGTGADSYDMSNYSSGVSIDLTPGGWSTTTFAQLADLNQFAAGYEARGNVFNALQYNGDARSLIENAVGGSGADVILGNSAVNLLTGNAGNDTLTGAGGADTLIGGTGADRLTGGSGADIFVFDDGQSGAAVAQRDLITDFTAGTDDLDLILWDGNSLTGGDDAFKWLGTAAFGGIVGSLRYFYDSARGITVIEGDTNGDASTDFAIDFSSSLTFSITDFVLGSLVPDISLTGGSGADLLEGDYGDDTLSGAGGNDTLLGYEGNDTLDGGSGSDTLTGGTGNDTYVLDSGTDTVVENAGEGTDTVQMLGNYTIQTNIEIGQLIGTGNYTITGGGGNDTLYGNSGDNSLVGGSGADTLIGGTGNDTYLVDNAGDVVTESAGAAFAPPAGWTIKGAADFDQDGDMDVLVTNGTSANQVWLLDGGAVSATIAASFWSTHPLLGFIDFNGDGYKDLLYQESGTALQQADYYTGGTSRTGYHVAYGGGLSPDAVQALAGANEGTDTVLASVSHTLADGVENLTLASGAGSIAGTGNALGNVITGNEGANVLTGGAGADTLTGGAGVDTFGFDDGESSAAAGKHDLVTDFTVGTDLLDLAAIDANTGVSGDQAFRFLGTSAFDGQAGALRYAYDGSGNVTVVSGDVNGDGSADFAIDLSGNKALTSSDFAAGSLLAPVVLTGGTGADVLLGGEAGDTLTGGGGNDTLTGLTGNDTLDGGAGADTLIGGTGNDTYLVDNAGDVVTESAGAAFTAPSGWTIKGTADFDHDGEVDVLVTNGSANQVWLLVGGTVSATLSVNYWSTHPVLGFIDYDGDGNKDILYQEAGGTIQQVNFHTGGATRTGYHVSYSGGLSADAVQVLAAANEGTDTVVASVGYTLGSGVENLTLASGAGSIAGTGNALGNVITGNEGANVLTGGAGADTLTGGAGVDIFAFDDGESSAATGKHDLIADFVVGTDLLDLAAVDANMGVAGDNAFRFLGTSGFDGQAGALRYSYDASGNVTVVSGDVNGDGSADFVIDLTGNKALSSADFAAGSLIAPVVLTGGTGADVLDGGEAGDTLIGGGGNDTLSGAAGNDTLDGGSGADTLIGGTGNDTYLVDNAGDVVTESAGAAFAPPAGWTIKGAADFDQDGDMDVLVTNGTSANQVWLLDGGAVSATIAASFWSTHPLLGFIDFNGDGYKDLLYQESGTALQQADYYTGGTSRTGYHVAYGGGLSPDAVQALAGANEGTDTVLASVSHTLADGVENLTLASGAGSIAGTGNALGNVITGNEGANVLTGGAGADTLTGGAGVDTFGFDDGESSAAAGKHDLVTDFTVGTDLLDLAAIDANTGVSGDQAFRFLGTSAFDGQAGALRYAYDGSGNVTVVSGDVNGDGSADFAIDLSGNKALTSSDFAAGSLLAPVVLTGGTGADVLLGGEAGDTLTGGGGNDTLTGLTGNDTLDGGAGADTLIGGTGNDTYLVDNAGDVVTESAGAAFTAPSGWTIKGTADFDHDGEVDVLVTNGSANQVWLLVGGTVSATLSVNYWSTHPVLGFIDYDGDGNKDILYQEAGGTIQQVNFHTGGATRTGYHVSYSGGLSADAVQVLAAANEGTDTVVASVGYTLGSGVENLTLASGAGSIAGTGNGADNAILGNGSDNILTGKGGADTLTGGGGNDMLWGEDAGGTGSAGDDRFVFTPGSGVDTIMDFTAGGTIDEIDLTAFGFGSFGQVMGNASAQGADTVISLAAGDTLILAGIAPAQLQMSDFIL